MNTNQGRIDMFGFVKEKLKKVYQSFTKKISSLFSRASEKEPFLIQLKELLLSSDMGVRTTKKVLDLVGTYLDTLRTKPEPEVVKEYLQKILVDLLHHEEGVIAFPDIVFMVGVNGSGKTSFVAKFAHLLKQHKKKVLLIAGDTFRAAATDQLAEWGKRIDVEVFVGKENQDPASVIFDGCERFKQGGFDHLIIDTAGRLQTKVNLMRELEKMRKVVDRQLPEHSKAAWLTIDAMLGQNSFQQAEIFHQATHVDGLVLTKLDGTGKGGVVFAIVEHFKIPVVYVTFGEATADIKAFDADEYVNDLLNE